MRLPPWAFPATENLAVSSEVSENLTGAIPELINDSSVEDSNNLSSTCTTADSLNDPDSMEVPGVEPGSSELISSSMQPATPIVDSTYQDSEIIAISVAEIAVE